MKKGYTFQLTALSILLSISGAFAQPTKSIFHAGFLYPISSHGLHARNYSNAISIHALAGVSGEERAFATSGIALIVKEDARGFKASGIANLIGGNADGFTTAGILNTYADAKGFQVAGIANIATDTIVGMQAAGIYNQAQQVKGFQLAGIANLVQDSVSGLQAAGIANRSQHVSGSQFSGFLNTAGSVNGSQISGFINIAEKVKGVQFAGFINMADSSEYPIGLINLIRNGEQSIGLTTDDNRTTLLGFRSGSRKMYGIVGVGKNLKNDKEVFALQLGIGANLFTTDRFRLKSELTHTLLESFKRGNFSKYSLGFLPSLRLGKIDIFAGPSIAFIQTSSDEGKKLVDNFSWQHTNNHNQLSGLYVGYTGGIHWKL